MLFLAEIKLLSCKSRSIIWLKKSAQRRRKVESGHLDANQKIILQLQAENRRLHTKISSLERMMALRNSTTREALPRSKFRSTQNLSIGPQSQKTMDASNDERSFKIGSKKSPLARTSIIRFPATNSHSSQIEPSVKKAPGIALVTDTQGMRRFDSVVNDWHRSNMHASMIDDDDDARLQRVFQKEEDLIQQLESMGSDRRRDLCYKVNSMIRDLKGCSKHIVRLRKQLVSYNKMSDNVDPINQFQVVAEQICSVLECERVGDI